MNEDLTINKILYVPYHRYSSHSGISVHILKRLKNCIYGYIKCRIKDINYSYNFNTDVYVIELLCDNICIYIDYCYDIKIIRNNFLTEFQFRNIKLNKI